MDEDDLDVQTGVVGTLCGADRRFADPVVVLDVVDEQGDPSVESEADCEGSLLCGADVDQMALCGRLGDALVQVSAHLLEHDDVPSDLARNLL